MESNDFKQIVDGPTHEKNGVLDLIFLPINFFVNSIKIFDRKTGVEISDHFPIKIELPFEGQKTKDYHKVKYRNFKDISLLSLKDDIHSALSNKMKINNNQDSLNESTNFFLETLSENIDHHAPLITKVIKKQPW